MNLSKSLKIACAQNDVYQRDVAKQLGITETNLSLLNEKKFINVNNLRKLADYFNMPISEFIALGEETKE